MIRKLLIKLFGMRSDENIEYEEPKKYKGMIAVRDDGCTPTPCREPSMETSRFYVGRDKGSPRWEEHGFTWQECELIVRRRKIPYDSKRY